MIVGFSTFCFTLLLHATGVRYGLTDLVHREFSASTPPHQVTRQTSFGQTERSPLSTGSGFGCPRRGVRRLVHSFRGADVGDFGCGYNATLARSLLAEVASMTLADVAVAGDLAERSEGHRAGGRSARRRYTKSPAIPSISSSACPSSSTSRTRLRHSGTFTGSSDQAEYVSSMCRHGSGSGSSNFPRSDSV